MSRRSRNSSKNKKTPRQSRRSQNRRDVESSRQGRSEPRALVGVLSIHREGYGFVVPDSPELVDVFIPQRRMGDALDGDQVKVRYWSSGRGDRQEGEVEAVLTRGRRFVVGVLILEAEEVRVRGDLGPQSFSFRVDRQDLEGARLGESVGIEIITYPQGQSPGSAKVVQLFGARGSESTEVDIIILKHQLPLRFPEAVEAEAREMAEQRDLRLTPGRQDLRSLSFVTIDGETARDFDDAILVQREGEGYRLWVSIADVSHYVREGSEVDREALARGTSVYFTDKVIPMLPEALSNDLCSLRPGEDRLSFTAEIELDAQGRVGETHFYKSLICSKARLTYTQVSQALIEKKTEAREKLNPVLPMLETAFELFEKMRRLRLQRGSIDFDLPEPQVIVDLVSGDTERIVKSERTQAHMLIEEFMVAANEAVANFLTRVKVPTLYRVHEVPDQEKIRLFQKVLHNLGFKVRLPDEPTPRQLAEILPLAQGHPEERLIKHLMLRSMKQAVYSPKNRGHYGLASLCYTHFTSPIRRYPDLVVHRVLEEFLTGKGERKSSHTRKARLSSIAIHTSRRERIAMEAEWEAKDLKVALFMSRFVGESFSGAISRVTKFGVFVELQEYFVEGLIPLEFFEDDTYFYEEEHLRLRGRQSRRILKIGTEIKVTVAKVGIEERKVYFRPEV